MPVINKKPKPTKQDIIDGLKLMKKEDQPQRKDWNS